MDRFLLPEALLLIALAPLAGFVAWWQRRRGGMRISSLDLVAPVRPSVRVYLRWIPVALRMGAIVCAAVALARPQASLGQTRMSTEGIAIMVVIDRSASMTAPMQFEGRETTRFEVVKDVFGRFVLGDDQGLGGRPADMIGLVAFAGFADTICPVVQSPATLVRLANAVNPAPPAEPEGGTAIGDALALACARLESAEAQINSLNKKSDEPPSFTIKSKVVVLITDGENNRGRIQPLEAAAFAKERGIKVYTIGVGGEGGYVYIPGAQPNTRVPIRDTIDEALLTTVANQTGGKYWNARTGKALRDCYAQLDALEKSSIDMVEFEKHEERYMNWAAAATGLLGAEILIGALFFRRVA